MKNKTIIYAIIPTNLKTMFLPPSILNLNSERLWCLEGSGTLMNSQVAKILIDWPEDPAGFFKKIVQEYKTQGWNAERVTHKSEGEIMGMIMFCKRKSIPFFFWIDISRDGTVLQDLDSYTKDLLPSWFFKFLTEETRKNGLKMLS